MIPSEQSSEGIHHSNPRLWTKSPKSLHFTLTLRSCLERSAELDILVLGLHLLVDLHDELVPGAQSPLPLPRSLCLLASL